MQAGQQAPRGENATGETTMSLTASRSAAYPQSFTIVGRDRVRSRPTSTLVYDVYDTVILRHNLIEKDLRSVDGDVVRCISAVHHDPVLVAK